MKAHRTTRTCILLASVCALASPNPVRAQEETKTEHQKKLDELKAEAELETARGARDKAAAERIAALGLPSFSGETKLEQGAGAMEATMLATRALRQAADEIAGMAARKAPDRDILVLAGTEAIDFSDVAMISTELGAIGTQFSLAGIPEAGESSRFDESNQVMARMVDPGTIIAAANALAGLLRSETTISPVDLPALSERVLANVVAGTIGSRAKLPAAAVGELDENSPLLVKLNAVADQRRTAAERVAELSVKATENAARIATLGAIIARFDSFLTRVTTASSTGVVPIARAIRLKSMMQGRPVVLRVFVDKAGGSLINTKNIATTFGVDPLKVTGAVVASYTLTEPGDGSVLGSEIYVCRTTLSRLRPIHDASWSTKSGKSRKPAQAVCTPPA